MELRRMTMSRLMEVERRQNPPAWGALYDPAIRATVSEAPSRSRPTLIWSDRLGRYVHTLSTAERDVAAVILYCDRLFELQEQRVLPVLPGKHPLATHPIAVGMTLPPMMGTLEVADALGCLSQHPKIVVKTTDGEQRLPTPWIGDFLLFLVDVDGPYCVNLNVKDTHRAFDAPTVGATIKTNKERRARKAANRNLVEEAVYESTGIPTRRVAGEDVCPTIAENLLSLIRWSKRPCSMESDTVEKLIEAVHNGIETQRPALDVILEFVSKTRVTFDEAKTAFHRAIWRRRIRVDLTEPLFLDWHLQPEKQDILDVFAHWFARS